MSKSVLISKSFIQSEYQKCNSDQSQQINDKKYIGKEKLSPQIAHRIVNGIRAFFLVPHRAAMTVEAALVLPLFLFFMLGAMQYSLAMESAAKYAAALTETGKTMAAAAYVTKYGGNTDGVAEFAAGALSAAYAHGKVVAKAGKSSAVKNTNMILSSFLQDGDMIDLVLTYQIKSPFSVVRLPGNFFLQRARVRAWTGRSTGEGSGEEGQEEEHDYVYVTATGGVYHDDPECTHLKLSIREVDADALGTLRNNNGGKYHACEKCGQSAGGTVYITSEGNRYHSSLSCSGLKRTVTQVSRDECSLRGCSKCSSAG